jgi:hypothetical protein
VLRPRPIKSNTSSSRSVSVANGFSGAASSLPCHAPQILGHPIASDAMVVFGVLQPGRHT